MKQSSVFILEGPDGGGKSTLAGSTLFMGEQKDHCGPPVGDPYVQYWGLVYDRVFGLMQRNVWVCDRLHLGEHVYGPIFRGEDRLTFARSRIIDRMLLAHKTVVVLCIPSEETTIENFRLAKKLGKDEMPERIDQIVAVRNAYLNLIGKFHLEHVVYDYQIETQDQLFERCLTKMATMVNKGHGIGRWAAGNVVVITDRDADPPLNESLDFFGVPEQRLYWLTLEQFSRDPRQVADMRAHKVITFGSAASEALANSAMMLHTFHRDIQLEFHTGMASDYEAAARIIFDSVEVASHV